MEDLSNITASLTDRQKSQLHEVADLMLDIFHTLVRMRYLSKDWIDEGPHDITDLLPTYWSLNLDPAIIYLYSILPYIKESYACRVDFIQGGEFADFRCLSTVEQGRDPFYGDSPEERLRPWMTPLSMIGNHCDAVIYNAREHTIGICGQMTCWSSTDRGLREGLTRISQSDTDSALGQDDDNDDDASTTNDQESEIGADGDEDDVMDEEREGEMQINSDEQDNEDEEEEEGGEEVYCDSLATRPATDVLRDIVRWYHELSEVPGGGEHTGPGWDQKLSKPLYQKHGWPGENFDGDAFEVELLRALMTECVKDDSEPHHYFKTQDLETLLEEELGLEMQMRKESLAAASSFDEQWVARWEMWQTEQKVHQLEAELREAQKEMYRAPWKKQIWDPKELLLREMARLVQELQWRRDHLYACRAKVESKQDDSSGGICDDLDACELRHAEKDFSICQRAYDLCKAEAEVRYPSTTQRLALELEMIERKKHLLKVIGETCVQADEVAKWISCLPEDANQARILAEKVEKEARLLAEESKKEMTDLCREES